MPFKSEAQRKFMWANHPEMAKRWESVTPKGKKLPEHVKTGSFYTPPTKTHYDPEEIIFGKQLAGLKGAPLKGYLKRSKEKKSMDIASLFSFNDELTKISKDLTENARDKIKGKNFAIPGERKYPIEDAAHARNALARVSQHGTPSEKSEVRHAVANKWPGVIGDETKEDLKKGKEKKSSSLPSASSIKSVAEKIASLAKKSSAMQKAAKKLKKSADHDCR